MHAHYPGNSWWKNYLSNILKFLHAADLIIISQHDCIPDRPFHNFGASKSVDWRILWSKETPIDGFWGFRIAKESVGCLGHYRNLNACKHMLLILQMLQHIGNNNFETFSNFLYGQFRAIGPNKSKGLLEMAIKGTHTHSTWDWFHLFDFVFILMERII